MKYTILIKLLRTSNYGSTILKMLDCNNRANFKLFLLLIMVCPTPSRVFM